MLDGSTRPCDVALDVPGVVSPPGDVALAVLGGNAPPDDDASVATGGVAPLGNDTSPITGMSVFPASVTPPGRDRPSDRDRSSGAGRDILPD